MKQSISQSVNQSINNSSNQSIYQQLAISTQRFTHATKQSSKQVHSFLPTRATPAANAGSAWPTDQEVICLPNKTQFFRASGSPVDGDDVGNVGAVSARRLSVLCRCTTASHPRMGFMSCNESRRWRCQVPQPLSPAAEPVRPGQQTQRWQSSKHDTIFSRLRSPVDSDDGGNVGAVTAHRLSILCSCRTASRPLMGFMSCNKLRRWRCGNPAPMWPPARINAPAKI